MPRLRWVKLWTQETLYGTTAKELTPDERAVWFGFLCLAGDSPVRGVICVAPGVPYIHSQLSKLLNVPPNLLRKAIQTLISTGKIEVSDAGIAIKNWSHYQADTARVQIHRENKQIEDAVTNVTPEDAVTNVTPPLDKTRLDQTRLDQTRAAAATAHEHAQGNDENFGHICRTFEAEIGPLTEKSEQLLGEIADDFTASWFEDAVKEAVVAGVRNLKYVKAILKRWKVEGRGDSRREKDSRGDGSAGSMSDLERCSICHSKHRPACKQKTKAKR